MKNDSMRELRANIETMAIDIERQRAKIVSHIKDLEQKRYKLNELTCREEIIISDIILNRSISEDTIYDYFMARLQFGYECRNYILGLLEFFREFRDLKFNSKKLIVENGFYVFDIISFLSKIKIEAVEKKRIGKAVKILSSGKCLSSLVNFIKFLDEKHGIEKMIKEQQFLKEERNQIIKKLPICHEYHFSLGHTDYMQNEDLIS